jgi:hypothetical protein
MILNTKDAKDDLAERLRHSANDDRTGAGSESRFQRWRFWGAISPGALPQVRMRQRL